WTHSIRHAAFGAHHALAGMVPWRWSGRLPARAGRMEDRDVMITNVGQGKWTLRPRRVAAACAVVLMGLAAAQLSRAAETGDLQRLPPLMLDLVNAERQERGLVPFQPDGTLDAAAQAHAEDMLRRDYYDHVSPGGQTVIDRYIAAGGSRW